MLTHPRLALIFDKDKALSKEFKGDGFVMRYAGGGKAGAANPNALRRQGKDLLHLHLIYDKKTDNYKVQTTRIVDNFTQSDRCYFDWKRNVYH